MQITSRGFQFLLEDVNTQLWDLLLQYLSLAESNDLDIVDVLACLFMLGSLELGKVPHSFQPSLRSLISIAGILAGRLVADATASPYRPR